MPSQCQQYWKQKTDYHHNYERCYNQKHSNYLKGKIGKKKTCYTCTFCSKCIYIPKARLQIWNYKKGTDVIQWVKKVEKKRKKERLKKWGFELFPKYSQWRFRRDVLWQSVPKSGSSDRKSSIANGWRRVCRTTSDDDEVEQRRWRAATADDWWSSSAGYSQTV